MEKTNTTNILHVNKIISKRKKDNSYLISQIFTKLLYFKINYQNQQNLTFKNNINSVKIRTQRNFIFINMNFIYD